MIIVVLLIFLIKLTEIIKIQSSVKSIGKSNVKKKSLYNQPKPYFISVIYGLSLQLQYGKLEKSLKCQKVWYDFF